ncbi:MAG: hypothetical protein BHV81_11880 [Butyricimonas synergistica]|nr:MAG: hypothetical protein BHV81_11880 [Butyricimonas synergistica]
MKKNLLYMLTAAAMLAGCAKNDVVDSEINKEGNLIGFSTYKNISRGNPVDDNDEFLTKDNAFGVTAFIKINAALKENPYMGTTTEGIKIVSDGNKWTYAQASDQAYWPVNDGESLDFYAYSPYGNEAITEKTFATTGLTLNYTVPAEEADQVDLMYAVALDKTKPTDKNSVTMTFKHALTQVHFAIGTSATNLFVDVKENGIQIHNLKNTGTLTTVTGLETDIWKNLTGSANYTVSTDAVDGAGYVDGDQKTFTTIGTEDKALMLLPQTLTANAEDVKTGNYLTINCKIYQKLADGTKIYLKGSDSEYAPVKVGIPGTWKRNQKITYNLNIGATAGILNPIEFETTVEEWDSIEGSTIDVK